MPVPRLYPVLINCRVNRVKVWHALVGRLRTTRCAMSDKEPSQSPLNAVRDWTAVNHPRLAERLFNRQPTLSYKTHQRKSEGMRDYGLARAISTPGNTRGLTHEKSEAADASQANHPSGRNPLVARRIAGLRVRAGVGWSRCPFLSIVSRL